MRRISELQTREEVQAHQRSRVQWLREGDRNTAFFHAKAKQRFRTNKIKSLQRENGSVEMSQTGLENMATDFYRNLFTAQAVARPKVVTTWVPEKVTSEMNERLTAPFRI